MKCLMLLTVLVFASKNENDVESVAANLGEKIMENAAENSIVVKIEEDEYAKKKSKSSQYVAVHYDERTRKWLVKRWSTVEKKQLTNGRYKDEETAAHASDTLARKLMANGEQGHKLNFPDDHTEMYKEEKRKSSEYFGVFYNASDKRWVARRWSKEERKIFNNGYHRDEETAAHASDTLARKLTAKGEKNLRLNFPDDHTEVERAKSSEYFGVTYNEKRKRWYTQRWSKTEKKQFNNGYHQNEETAAHASDTLARKLVANGEQGHKLNFPDNNTEVHPEEYQTNKRKRSFEFNAQTDRHDFEKFEDKEK